MQPDLSKRADTAAAIDMVRENSLATLVQRALERQIVSGETAVGTKLNEVDVAIAMGVSRGPVREAFRALGQAGLVSTEKNRGVFVRQVTLEQANEIYEVRAALEGLIGKLAARHIDSEEVEQLRSVTKKMAAHNKAPKAGAYFALNVEFHDTLARAARNGALLTHYRRVVNELDLYRRETISRSTENIPISTREHDAIVTAVSRRDEALAERLLTEHVLQSRERLHSALAKPAAKLLTKGRRGE